MAKRTGLVIVMIVVLLSCLAATCGADPVPVPGVTLPGAGGLMYLATLNESPGIVLFVDATGEHRIFRRPANNLTSLSFGPMPGGLQAAPGVQSFVFCNGISQQQIWRATSNIAEALLMGAATYIREVCFGPGALYYSHSSGAAANGRIMRLSGGAPALHTLVRLPLIGGFWAGNFAFGPAGTLYVSSGNITGAKIWRYPLGGVPSVAFDGNKGSILGFCFKEGGKFLYTDGSHDVLEGHIGGVGPDGVAYTSPLKYKFCDVVIR